ncbi:MAG: response regulator [Candidatus Cloacimonetes bacterium]|nr:response regulator [Candidatus Cloacimonadota bacterium]
MKSILIIEDELNLNFDITSAFKNAGFEADMALTGEVGLKKLQQKKYDGIIIDFKLPGITGLDILEEIQDLQIGKILTSGFGSNYLKEEATKLGAVFIDKPFENEKLINEMNKLISQKADKKEKVKIAK